MFPINIYEIKLIYSIMKSNEESKRLNFIIPFHNLITFRVINELK